MTDDVKRAGALLDVRGVRVALCAAGAVAIWCVFAVCFVHGLWRQERPAPVRKPVAFDVKLVLLQPPPPAPAPAPAATAAKAAPAAEPRARNAQSSRAMPPVARPAQRSVSAAVKSAAATTAPPPDVAHRDDTVPAAPAALTQSAPTSTQPAAQTPSANSPPSPATADQANAAHAASGAAGSPASGGNGVAHAIIQPLPSLPDDLRSDAFQAVATARFTIHRDGSVDVELIKPTHNPRLNQLLLDALQKWRFFPAMKNGTAVESSQDIRVHFNVD
ncbi:hypothetical protein GCM10027093_21880 [Paraburkholderia jirisanensis]